MTPLTSPGLFPSPPNLLPFDLEAQNQQLAQKKMVLDAMMRQSQTPQQGQMVSGHFVAPSPLSYISQLLSGVAGYGLSKSIGQDQAKFGQDYRQQLSSGVQDYLKTRQGTPGQTMSDAQAGDLMNNDVAPTLADPVAPNPRKAIVDAMSSQIPELRQIGAEDMKNLRNETWSNPVTERNPDTGAPIQVQYSNQGTRKVLEGALPGPKLQVTPDNKLVDENAPKGPAVVLNAGVKFGPMQDVKDGNGNSMTDFLGQPLRGQQDENGVWHDQYGQKMNITLPASGKEQNVLAGGKVLESSRAEIIKSDNDRRSAERLYALAKDPSLISGAFAGPAGTLAAVGTKLGFTGPDAADRTQAFLAETAKAALGPISQLRPASDKDVEFATKASSGQIDWTPQALQHLAGLSIEAAHNRTMNAFQQYQSAKSVPGVEEQSPLYPIPPMSYQLPPEFKTDDFGRARYQSPLLKPSGQKQKPTVSNW